MNVTSAVGRSAQRLVVTELIARAALSRQFPSIRCKANQAFRSAALTWRNVQQWRFIGPSLRTSRKSRAKSAAAVHSDAQTVLVKTHDFDH
jgi:hypothetical protein